ncbi:Inner membrane transport protein YbaT [Novipirellula aureliae]|uniref:Inner membrane transport protein YbaT n=1 Tax=Novipirellula aureliae TaxID=2527966 RepID=A0A5C6EA45_9BACT|nr:APC family permease [Novipirellula aureliae]TWU45882.1 Inner membrane transport protein YbaT [Novipirellula aureliae]
MTETNSEPGNNESKLGALSTLSIGIGGMVGGGIFAVTGLTIQVTRGGAPIAFLIAGIVALLTSYSYLKLTLRFPGEGGTVDFLNRGFGSGIVTGSANILLVMSYVVLVAVYAYAFGSYGASFFPEADRPFWSHVLTSGVIVGLVILNILASNLVIRSENAFNAIKMLLLTVFIVAGLLTPMDWTRLSPDNFVAAPSLIAGAMLIFLNYEGFELIANASKDVANPKRTLPIAYIGGVLVVIAIYMLIVIVVVGHLSFGEVAKDSDTALSVAAEDVMGRTGFIAIAVAALLATSSAINATFFSTGKLAYIIAKTGELPTELERSFRSQHFEGTLITAALALVVANLVPLEAIATMGSAGFLLIFMMVNIANIRLARETNSHAWLSGLAALSTAIALILLCIKVDENPATRNHLWILVGMIVGSFAIEIVYRKFTGRQVQLNEEKVRT